jgi:hypothetical protein
MVAFYLMRITDGKMTVEEVPPKWHDEVEEKLKEE